MTKCAGMLKLEKEREQRRRRKLLFRRILEASIVIGVAIAVRFLFGLITLIFG